MPMVLISSRCAMISMLPMRPLARHTMFLRAAALLALSVATPACVAPGVTDRAQTLVRQHKEDQAVALLRTDLAAHPDDVPARRLLVRLLGFTGDLPGARAQAEELSRIRGAADPTAYIELGHA